MYNILLLGSGGREHTLAWKITQSPLCQQLFVAQGNAGTASIATNVALSPTDFEAVAQFCRDKNIQMLVVGSEEPLVKGIRNFLEQQPDLQELMLIAPNQQAAQLEGSKEWSKAFMQKYNIPTAKARSFNQSQYAEAVTYIQQQSVPIVIKADGLAAGKGVVIAPTHQQALLTLKAMLLENKFGQAGHTVVIEEFLTGIELSVFVLTDGKEYVLLPEAKDYKRIGEQDTGLNTGGMGAISPVPFANKSFMEKVEEQIILPTLKGLQAEGIVYQGFIFFGLIKVGEDPHVIEYNCRLGDPETEVVIPRLQNDLVALFEAMHKHQLSKVKIAISPQAAATIMLVSAGYPEQYEKHKKITAWQNLDDVIAFHAGTTFNEQQEVVTNGGRVIALTALAPTLSEALQKSLSAAQKVNFEGKYYRTDIGKDVLL